MNIKPTSQYWENNMKIYALLFFVISSIQVIYGQDQGEIDSLKKLLFEEQDQTSQSDRLIRIGELYIESNLDSAIYFLEESKSLISEGNHHKLLRYYNNMGIAYMNKGIYNKAIFYYLEGLKIADKSSVLNTQITFTINIGALHDRQKDYNRAETYYLKAIDLIENAAPNDSLNNKSLLLAHIYNNLGNVYHDGRDDSSKGRSYYDKGLSHARRQNDDRILAILLNNIGNLLINSKKYEEGYKSINEALAINIKSNNVKAIAQTYRNLGNYFKLRENYDSAIHYYYKSIEYAEKVGSMREILDSREGLSKSYEAQNHIDKAYVEYKKFKILSDSLLNETRLNEISRIESKYEFEKEQERITLKQKERERNFYYIFSILVALALIMGLMARVHWTRVKATRLKNEHLALKQQSLELEKENLNMELLHKKKEMTTKVMYLYQKNELLDRVIKQLGELQSNLKSENKPIVRKVIKNLGEVINEEAWEEFEIRFNEIHHEFYVNLEKRFPELTPNERKLCAFLKLNMTSKEISSLTGQSVRSIDVARTRLRKKLNLTNTDINLVDFFNSIG